MAIQYFTEDIDFQLEQSKDVFSWLEESIRKEECEVGEINYIFCSDNYLLKVNQDYLEHDYYTDIITFDYRVGSLINGDLFISIDRVKENASDQKVSEKDELHRVMVHGLLHIIGYKDKSPEEERLMRSKEDFYLSLRSF